MDYSDYLKMALSSLAKRQSPVTPSVTPAAITPPQAPTPQIPAPMFGSRGGYQDATLNAQRADPGGAQALATAGAQMPGPSSSRELDPNNPIASMNQGNTGQTSSILEKLRQMGIIP